MHRCAVTLISVLSFISLSALYGTTAISILPDESVPSKVVMENDSLMVEILLGRYVYFTSFKDKISQTEFIDPDTPAPVVKINSKWHLLQVGFNIQQVCKFNEGDKKGVQIELFSDYWERLKKT